MTKVYKPVEEVLAELNIPQVLSVDLQSHIKKYGSGCCRIGNNEGGVVNIYYPPAEETALQSIITSAGMVFICKCADEVMMTVAVKGEALKYAEAADAAREEKVKTEYTKPTSTPAKEEKKTSTTIKVATVAASVVTAATVGGAVGFFLWKKFSK